MKKVKNCSCGVACTCSPACRCRVDNNRRKRLLIGGTLTAASLTSAFIIAKKLGLCEEEIH